MLPPPGMSFIEQFCDGGGVHEWVVKSEFHQGQQAVCVGCDMNPELEFLKFEANHPPPLEPVASEDWFARWQRAMNLMHVSWKESGIDFTRDDMHIRRMDRIYGRHKERC